jgi:hypothetical protein
MNVVVTPRMSLKVTPHSNPEIIATQTHFPGHQLRHTFAEETMETKKKRLFR